MKFSFADSPKESTDEVHNYTCNQYLHVFLGIFEKMMVSVFWNAGVAFV